MDSFSIKGFDIFAEEALHSVTALAYRLEAEERVIVYSGVTPSPRPRGGSFSRWLRSAHSRVLIPRALRCHQPYHSIEAGKYAQQL